jgi:hypothetical protein
MITCPKLCSAKVINLGSFFSWSCFSFFDLLRRQVQVHESILCRLQHFPPSYSHPCYLYQQHLKLTLNFTPQLRTLTSSKVSEHHPGQTNLRPSIQTTIHLLRTICPQKIAILTIPHILVCIMSMVHITLPFTTIPIILRLIINSNRRSLSGLLCHRFVHTLF